MITFYATVDADSLPQTVQALIPPVPLLLPASSFARRGFPVPRVPPQVPEVAADSGGFVAMRAHHGRYPYSPARYVAWLRTFRPTWAATMDYPCEPALTAGGQARLIWDRQARTTRAARYFWRTYRAVPWVWVPTVQGWTLPDYVRHARALAPLVTEMATAYGPESAFRVGIGTLCARVATRDIRAIVRAVAVELPGVPLHLWGVKLGALADRVALPPAVRSVDSAAWSGLFGRGREVWRRSGQTQRAWAFGVALPAYGAKVAAALAAPKQAEMIFQEALA